MSMQTKWLTPLALVAALALAWALAGALPAAWQRLGEAALAACALAFAGLAVYAWCNWLAPLAKLAERVDALAPGGTGGEAERVAAALETFAERARAGEVRAASEAQARALAEERLRESEERYALALRCSKDGLWEWDLKRDTLTLSARWKAMLGFPVEAIGNSLAEWRTRLHPEDRARVCEAIQGCVSGEAAEFASEHRLLRADGGVRWVLSRGTVLRHANGKAYRFVGLDTDITEVKRASDVLLRVAAGTADATGEEFFARLVENFASVLGVRIAFITECANKPTTRLRTLAWWDRDRLRPNFEFELAGTPCQAVIEDGATCFHPQRVRELFPNERMESYLGIPIFDSDGTVIGHLAFFDEKPMLDDMMLTAVYRIFTARAGAELQRRNALKALQAKSLH